MRPITTYDVFNGAQTVTTAAAVTSVAFDMREIAQNGIFSIDYANATSGGTLAITYTVCSTKAGTYFTPTGGGSIVSGLSTATGGKSFKPECYPFMKIVLTATTQTCVAAVHLNVQ
jgi:hypothetical protein